MGPQIAHGTGAVERSGKWLREMGKMGQSWNTLEILGRLGDAEGCVRLNCGMSHGRDRTEHWLPRAACELHALCSMHTKVCKGKTFEPGHLNCVAREWNNRG